MHHLAAGGSKRWVKVRVHGTLPEALAALPADAFQLLARTLQKEPSTTAKPTSCG